MKKTRTRAQKVGTITTKASMLLDDLIDLASSDDLQPQAAIYLDIALSIMYKVHNDILHRAWDCELDADSASADNS